MYIHFMDDIKWNKVSVKCYKILHFVSKSSWIKINLLLYDFSDYHFLNSVFSRYATHWNNKKKWKETCTCTAMWKYGYVVLNID